MPWGSLQIIVLPQGFCTNTFQYSMDCQNLWCRRSISLIATLVLPLNFLNFRFYAVEWQSIVDLSRYGSKGYTLVFLGYSEITFLGKRKMQPFVHQSIMFWSYSALQHRRSISSNFPIFYTFGGISSRIAAFLLLIFLCITSKFSYINCPSLMSSRLQMIFVIGSSVTGGFSKQIFEILFSQVYSFILGFFWLTFFIFHDVTFFS